MASSGFTAATVVGAAVVAAAVALAVERTPLFRSGQGGLPANALLQTVAVQKTARPQWIASAPGRVEPRDGEVRISAQVPGRVADVLVRINDVVKAGDLLARQADDEAQAKLLGAEADAAVRRRERDNETVPRLAQDRRVAEDAHAAALRAVYVARVELDALTVAVHGGKGGEPDVEKGRAAVRAAVAKAEQERTNLLRVQAIANMPLPTRLEAGLTIARAERLLAEAAVERMRIRAPSDGTVLQVLTKAGEMVAPTSEDVLIVFGDVSSLRVRAEVEERDVGKVRPGLAVVVRTDAMPGREFEGKVERMAQALGSPRLAGKGPRKPSDVEVLEVLITLADRPPLMPGMRVDVFFKPDATVGTAPATKAN